MVATPQYYINKFPTVTVNETLVGAGADALITALSEVLKVGRKSTTLNFLVQNTASQLVGQSVLILFDPVTKQYQVNGKIIIDSLGNIGVAAVIPVILSTVGIGAGIVGVTAAGVSLASSLIWTALTAFTEIDETIVNLIDSVAKSVRGEVPVNLQILDTNGKVLGGAIFKESINPAQELEAIKMLLGWATQAGISSNFPSISTSNYKIRAVEKTTLFPEQRTYDLYDGKLIDVVSQSLGIAKDYLLALGEKNPTYANSTNNQIYFSSQTSQASSIFVRDSSTRRLSNRLFIPLPTKTDGESTRVLHPSNILVGSENKNILDAYLANGPSSPFFNQDALLIGTGVSNDSLKGSGGNDVFIGGKGNDEIDGRQGGEDTAIFSDNYKNYDISFLPSGSVTLSHLRGAKTDGTDRLTNVEFAKFKDGTLSLLSLFQNSPRQQLGNYQIQQVSTDDIISGVSVPIVSGSYVYWQSSDGGSLYDERTIRFDTNTRLLSGLTSSSVNSYAIRAVNEDKILLLVDYKDRSPHKLELHTSDSLIRVGNVSDFDNKAVIFGDNILLEIQGQSRQRQLVAYNYKNGTTATLAENNYSSSSTLPSFIGVSYAVRSGNKIAWTGSTADNTNDAKIFCYDGNTTTQIPRITQVNGSIYSRPDASNLQLSGNNIFWTSGNPVEAGVIDLFLYNGTETRQIAKVNVQTLDPLNGFKFSGDRVVWSTQETVNANVFLNRLYLYDGTGVRSIYESRTTIAQTGSSYYTGKFLNLSISGENIVWTERYKSGAVVDDFYLYDIGNSASQPKLLSKGIDSLLYPFSFRLFGEQIAWTAPITEVVQTGASKDKQNQLHAYDGNSVWQLTNLASNSYDYISTFDVSGKGIVWVANDDGDKRDKSKPEIFVANLVSNLNPGTIAFSSAQFSVKEDGTPVNTVRLTRSGGSDGVVSSTIVLTNGTAIATGDYNNAPITVNFANGETSKTITIPIVNDSLFEPDETIILTLSNPTGGVTLGSQNIATLIILNDDIAAISSIATGADFNRNSKTDLIWRNYSTGQNVVWLMDGTSLNQGLFITPVADINWSISGTGDFDRDGQSDVLWRNYITGDNVIWLMNGTNIKQGLFTTRVSDTNWSIGGTGDFNRDGQSDILWRNNATGDNVIWLMNGTNINQGLFTIAVADLNWSIAGTGDFNQDGQSDIIWRNGSAGKQVVWLMNGTNISQGLYINTDVADTNWRIGNSYASNPNVFPGRR